MTPNNTADKTLARFATVIAFTVLLAGQYSFNRVGGSYQWPIPLNALVAAASIAILAQPLTTAFGGPHLRRLDMPGRRAIIWYFILLMLSGLWSTASTVDIADYWNILTLLLVIFLLSSALKLSRKAAVNTFMAMSAAAGLVFAVIGLLSAGEVSRIAAFGGGPNAFARVTGMGMVAVIYFVVNGARRTWFTLLLAPLGAATVLSGSRGAMLGTFVALVVLALALDRRGFKRLAVGLALASPAILLIYSRFGTLVLQTVELRIIRLTFEEGYTSGRGDLWSEAWVMFQDHPLFGSGLGSFTDRYLTYPHNLVLQTAAELGLAGLASLTLILLICIRRSISLDFRAPSVVAPIAGACLIFVASLFSGGYYDTRYLWAYILLAMSQPLAAIIPNAATVVDLPMSVKDRTVVGQTL